MEIYDLSKNNGYTVYSCLGKEKDCGKNSEDPSILIDLCHAIDANEFQMSPNMKLSNREKNLMFLSRDVADVDKIMGMCMDVKDSIRIQMNSEPPGEYQHAFDRGLNSAPRIRVEIPRTIERLKKYNVANLKGRNNERRYFTEVVDPFNKREAFNERGFNYPQCQVFGHGLYDFYYHHLYHNHSHCSCHKLSNPHCHFHEAGAHKVGLSSCKSKTVEKQIKAGGKEGEVETGSRKKHDDDWHQEKSSLRCRKHGLMSQTKARNSVFCQSPNMEDENSTKIQESRKHPSSSEKSISFEKNQTESENRAEKILNFINSCLPLIAARQEALVFIAFCFVAILLFLMRATLWNCKQA
ncbi:uncharacterized protein LOC118761214 [Octopus sinensis]|uniref:Uncharacterized protein LOC118761214 n=1 Tax=Octopus sinensis TaxID=2607531 RepID=A0A7E6EHP8_9MOLL|nr:uncharacterized protein LOC118761214 [Octopus sinensis]